ncbi:MAG TPA: transcription elongation factor GreA [Dehalococcoidia bacterium]
MEQEGVVKEQGLTLDQAISTYLEAVPPGARTAVQGELLRFARWYGGDRPLERMTGHEVATYAQEVATSGADPYRRLEPVREFLSHARKAGWTATNLATHVRLRKGAGAGNNQQNNHNQDAVQLTQEAKESLERELEELKARRPKIAEMLRQAMADKDFRENAPLDAARDQQAHLEARIREIEATLRRAVIVETPEGRHDVVRLGSRVLVQNLSSGQEQRFILVSPHEVNAAQGKISVASPVGRALMDRAEGEEVEVAVPAGTVRFRIQRIEG